MAATPDNRREWLYRGCKVIPMNWDDCEPNTGLYVGSKAFGDGILRSRYWKVICPDNSWVWTATKQAARDHIDRLWVENSHHIRATPDASMSGNVKVDQLASMMRWGC